MKRLSFALVAAYPILAHMAVRHAEPRLGALGLLFLCTSPMLPALARPSMVAWILLPIIAAALYASSTIGDGLFALYLPSLVIPALLMMLFGSSLRSGRTPLITQMAKQSPDPLTPAIAAYTRRWTEAWTGLFGWMLLSAAVLAALGLKEWWSVMTNFVNYGLAAAFFVIEYFYRRWRFPERHRTGFFRYLRDISQFDIRQT